MVMKAWQADTRHPASRKGRDPEFLAVHTVPYPGLKDFLTVGLGDLGPLRNCCLLGLS